MAEPENAMFEHKMNKALNKVINEFEDGGIFALFALAEYSQALLNCSDHELAKRFPSGPHAGEFYRGLAGQVLPIVDEAMGLDPGSVH